MVDGAALDRTVERFRRDGILLPTFEQLADPTKIPDRVRDALAAVDPDASHPLNLFRVHWFDGADRRSQVSVPDHVVLPPELTGVDAKIVL
ncbi:MAG TPA: pyridoxal-5'-phosphate-dependent protein subunit beta, partial [Actinomycetota bacterium]